MLTQLVFSLFRYQWHQKNGHCRGNNAIHCVTGWISRIQAYIHAAVSNMSEDVYY